MNWLEIAAQAWCDPRTSAVEMQPELATVFAEMLAKYSDAAACICAVGLPDPECPQHGVHSAQASVFYNDAYRANIQSKCAHLTGVLHRELLDTGLVTAQQWNDKIAPALVAVDQAVETPREWAERTLAPPQAQQRGPLAKTASYEAAQPAEVNPASTQTKLNTKGKA